MKKLTKKQINQLKPFWKDMQRVNDSYFESLDKIEKKMSDKLGIKYLEFFWCDNYIVGIGDANRKIKLVQRDKLEKK